MAKAEAIIVVQEVQIGHKDIFSPWAGRPALQHVTPKRLGDFYGGLGDPTI